MHMHKLALGHKQWGKNRLFSKVMLGQLDIHLEVKLDSGFHRTQNPFQLHETFNCGKRTYNSFNLCRHFAVVLRQ